MWFLMREKISKLKNPYDSDFNENCSHLYSDSSDVEKNMIERETHNTMVTQIKEGMELLSEKEKTVLKNRFFCEEKMTFKAIATALGISAEAVRKIEKKAILKIKEFIARKQISA